MAITAKPDLAISSLALAITSLRAGDATTVNFSIANSGAAAAAASTAGIYLNNNGNLTLLKPVAVPALGANGATFNIGGVSVMMPAGIAPDRRAGRALAPARHATAPR